jgi:hypothetical protein
MARIMATDGVEVAPPESPLPLGEGRGEGAP